MHFGGLYRKIVLKCTLQKKNFVVNRYVKLKSAQLMTMSGVSEKCNVSAFCFTRHLFCYGATYV